jgi:hypothetical protein
VKRARGRVGNFTASTFFYRTWGRYGPDLLQALLPQGKIFNMPGILLLALMATTRTASAQDTLGTAALPPTPKNWSTQVSVLTILLRDTITLWNPSVFVDKGTLHMEARYQWEDWRTASLWAGYNFEFGDRLHVVVSPMAGVVFGNLNGVAPGYQLNMAWRSLSLYSTSEYFIDLKGNSADFNLTWNELAVDLKVLRFGLAAQRTRIFRSQLDIQRGILLQRQQGAFNFGLYLFNVGWAPPTVAFTLNYWFEGASPSSAPVTP